MGYNNLDDKELYDKLEKAELASRLKGSSEWKLLEEAARRIVDRAITEFALKTKADDIVRIIELKTIIKKYKFMLFDELEMLVQEGEYAFEEAKQRDIIGKDR